MTLLYRIIFAAHARGTHHKLALDALRHLSGPDAERRRRLVLEHVAVYLEGAKAPDTEFKDFTNHVLHVRDDYWGGAVDKTQSWYGRLVGELKAGRWSSAVYAAGVLSHYYTDPIHPFHTAQSEAETNIHRAVEWSISQSYDTLRAAAERAYPNLEIPLSEGPDWLRDLVCRGAELSNTQYERLIAHYDIHRGVVDPPEGLDPLARQLVGELLVYAAHGLAAILDRAFAEAAAVVPDVNLTADTAVAALRMPAKWLMKRLADAKDRRAVQAMYDELMATGRVEQTLPEDDRTVRDRYRIEVAAPREAALEAARARVLAADGRHGTNPAAAVSRTSVVVPPAPAAAAPAACATNGADAEIRGQRTASASLVRPRLAVTDDIERAPSIGPRTAERLVAVGIRTVQDLLSADVSTIASRLDARHITPDVIRDWQAEAALAATIPGLSGTGARLLVGAGYRSASELASAEPAALCAGVLTFAATPAGQRVLQDGKPPDLTTLAA